MSYLEELLKRHNLPSNFEGRIVKRPMGAKRQSQLYAQAGAEWDPNAPDGLGGPSVEPFLKVLLNSNKMTVSDLPWLKRQLAAQIPAGGDVPCDPFFGLPYTFQSGSPNMPSINRLDNSKGHTRDNCEVIAARCNTREDDAYPYGLTVAFTEVLTEVRSLFDLSQAGALAAAKALRKSVAQLNLR